MPSRRAVLLGTAAVAGSLAAAGCLGGAPAADGVGGDGAANVSTGTDGPTPRPSASAATTDPPDTPAAASSAAASTDALARPARGADVTVSRTVTDPDPRYDGSRDAVRIVAAYRHTNHEAVANGSEPPTREPLYEWLPFERWAETECASVAAEAVRDATEKRLGSVTGLSVGVGSADEGDSGDDAAVTASLTTTYDRDGNVVSEPDATVAAVAAAAPASVTATVRLGGRGHTCTHRVTVGAARVYYQ